MHPKLLLAICFIFASTVIAKPSNNTKPHPKKLAGKTPLALITTKETTPLRVKPTPKSNPTPSTTQSTPVFRTPLVKVPTTTTKSTALPPPPPPSSPPSSTKRPPASTSAQAVTTKTSPPSSSAPPSSASSVPPAPVTNCNPSVPLAVQDPVPPPCPNGYTWPALDQAPPIAGPWLALVDQTKVPPAPLNGLDTNNDVANTNSYSATNDPFCSWTFTQCLRKETDITTCSQPNQWGITYDDGPQPPSPVLYDYLSSVGQKATLFVIGSRAIEYSSTLLKAYQAGHQLAIHTWSHPYLTTQSTETIIAEIKWTEMAIQAITGVRPRYFRAPHGDLDDRVRYIVNALGYKIIQWNRDTLDWMLFNPDTYHMNPSWVDGNFSAWSTQDKGLGTGIITLEHENSLDAVCEAEKSYVIMRNAGWTPLPIADCLGDPNYYIEGGPPQQASSSLASQVATDSASASQLPNYTMGPSQLVQPSSDALSLTSSVAVGLLGFLAVFVAIGA